VGPAESRKQLRPSRRLEQIPPYLFAELERKVQAKRAAGIDVISLGIGDPDTPTYAPIVEAAQKAVANPGTHRYPTNRGRPEFREAVAMFYERRFGVALDPRTEVMPAIGAKECIFNLNLAFLDPGDVALAADPGYPVYTGGPLLAGAQAHLMPLLPAHGFAPDFEAIATEVLEQARLMFLNYPNNPTGAILPEGLFERAIELARRHDLLVVHDNAYSEITYDGYVAPSFLATPGAKEVGVEVFSLSKGYNMTGWRCAAIVGNAEAIEQYGRLKSNIDSGLVDAIQLAGAAALGPRLDDHVRGMRDIYRHRRDLICAALGRAGVEVAPPKGTIYVWAPVPEDFSSSAEYCEHVLDQAAVVLTPGAAYGPSGEGFFRISLTTPDERLREAVERLRAL
jgi:LL-diaminopimelate aminotransferase